MIEQHFERQRELCDRVGALWVPVSDWDKVGLARNTSDGDPPLNGLRHPPSPKVTGWYIWSGQDLHQDDDFFEPVHVVHLAQLCPAVLPYLGLEASWRFLLAPNYEDVWKDLSLLDV